MAARVLMALLGGFVVEVDGAAIPDASWRLRKSRSVLKLLALTPGRALHTDRIEGLLWPDREPAAAGNNLRQAVYHARRALSGAGADGAAVLELRGDLLTLASSVEVDADQFERCAERAEAGDERALDSALALYTGELLPEDSYEDWTSEPRRALAERYVRLLLTLAASRDPAGATDPLHRALQADPLNEEAHRALMRAYAASGRRPQALAHYDELRRNLAADLGADPEPDTRALYRGLLAEGAPEPLEESPTAAAGAAMAPVSAPPPRERLHNLPWQATSFIGRRRELEDLGRTLASHRLVTLTGPGGCGKTRLALELARTNVGTHRDGVWVIELAAVGDGALVGQAAAAALGLDLRPDEAPEAGLAQHLAERELLLVVDNCEHVIEACVRLVETVLAQCPGVRIVATSREPLHLPGEVDWRVPSLAMIDTATLSNVDELATADAVELFVDRARSANPRFNLSVANAQAVAEICLRVDGLPLAIELAAARTTALSPAEIATRLGDGLAVLRAARSGGLTRQQTLEGTLDWSHDLLDARERELFRRLSVFAGGFELEAAEDVANDDSLPCEDVLDVLAGLVDKSLVGVDDVGDTYRYRLLEPVRQYAALRLRESGETAAQVERHARWFAALACEPGGRVTELDPQRVERLERDHDNLRAGLAWLLEHDAPRALDTASGMAGLWLLRAHLREGCRWLDRALAAAPEHSPGRPDALHARQALERRRPYNYDLADDLSRERIEIYRAADDPRNVCVALLDLAEGEFLRGRFARAVELADEAWSLAGALGEDGLSAAARERIGLPAAARQDFDAAETAFADAAALCESARDQTTPVSSVISLSGFIAEVGDLDAYPSARLEETSLHFRRRPPGLTRASLLSHRSYVARCRGDYAQARLHLDSALEIVRAHRGNPLDEARLITQRGTLELHTGELDAAAELLGASLAMREELREHRGVLLVLATLAIVAARQGDEQRAEQLLARAQRMAEEAVDGPGMGGVLQARSEIERGRGDLAAACTSLEGSLAVFYGVTGLRHYASWVHLQHAYLSLELADGAETARRLELAWGGFSESDSRPALERCIHIGARLRAANGLLTPGEWSPPDQQYTEV